MTYNEFSIPDEILNQARKTLYETFNGKTRKERKFLDYLAGMIWQSYWDLAKKDNKDIEEPPESLILNSLGAALILDKGQFKTRDSLMREMQKIVRLSLQESKDEFEGGVNAMWDCWQKCLSGSFDGKRLSTIIDSFNSNNSIKN